MGPFGGFDLESKGWINFENFENIFFSVISGGGGGGGTPSTPTKNVVGLKRARNMREKEILDRTLPHLDHADNPRQTTHAVGVLKAVSLGKQYPG